MLITTELFPGTEYRLAAPNGGDTLMVGSTYSISWRSNQLSPDMNIELSTDGGNNWDTIATGILDCHQSSYLWAVPNNMLGMVVYSA